MSSTPMIVEGDVAPQPPVPVTKSDKPKGKRRGRGSSDHRQISFNNNQSARFHAERRARLDAALNPGIGCAFQFYLDQQQHGSSVARVVPVTTRGIGFHCLMFLADAERHISRVELPPRATIHQLYRYSLMQLARQVCLSESGPTHTLAPRMPQTPRVGAFSAHRNGTFLADAISQIGSFKYDNIQHHVYIPNLTLEMKGKITSLEPHYEPLSPGASPAKRPANPVNSVVTKDHLYIIPDPYHITIFNLRDAVTQLSNPECPVELRRLFISRNPIPGARFVDDLLVNPSDVMPSHYFDYSRQQFRSDISDCLTLFDQMIATNPVCVGEIAMDGKGSELCLVTVRTPPGQDFRIDDGLKCDGSSHMYASYAMSNVNRLRACVNLMSEMPLLTSRTFVDSSFGVRDPALAVHTFVEDWPTLAWNVSPFSRS